MKKGKLEMTRVVVYPKRKMLILPGSAAAQVQTVIPSARTTTYKGRSLTVVPHRLDETKVLRNLGFDAPSPVEWYYNFPGLVTPMNAQRETVAFAVDNPRGFILNEMGTGKTLAAIWAFDYLRSIARAKRLLVVTPLSTVYRVWADEIFSHLPHLEFAVLHGDRAKRVKLLAQPADVYVINHDGVEVIQKELLARDDIDTLVIDEISMAYRNQSTDRWKAIRTLVERTPRVWGMTGTPIPNSPLDAYAQIKLIRPDAVPKYFGKFRDMVMRQVSAFQWVPREGALEVVASMMQPAIRIRREDCVDLPPTIYEARQVDLTREQAALWQDMRNRLHAEFAGGQITAVNEAVKQMKLVQIVCGAAYDNQGETVVIPATHRVNEVRDIIEEAGGKVIVFVPFTSALEAVATALRRHFSVEIVHGSVAAGERNRIFAAFQKATDPRVLVAQPAAMAHGLTLTAASVIVWFAPVTSAEIYAQGNARIIRPGQKRTQVIVHIESTPLERAMYQRLRNKEATQGALLQLIREGVV
jgi:SNF2 family DNA or RNA helicase